MSSIEVIASIPQIHKNNNIIKNDIIANKITGENIFV